MHLRRAGVALLCNVVVKETAGPISFWLFLWDTATLTVTATGIHKEDVDHIFVIL